MKPVVYGSDPKIGSVPLNQFLGSKIRVVTRNEIRYEGTLQAVNPIDETVTLHQVVCVNKEGPLITNPNQVSLFPCACIKEYELVASTGSTGVDDQRNGQLEDQAKDNACQNEKNVPLPETFTSNLQLRHQVNGLVRHNASLTVDKRRLNKDNNFLRDEIWRTKKELEEQHHINKVNQAVIVEQKETISSVSEGRYRNARKAKSREQRLVAQAKAPLMEQIGSLSRENRELELKYNEAKKRVKKLEVESTSIKSPENDSTQQHEELDTTTESNSHNHSLDEPADSDVPSDQHTVNDSSLGMEADGSDKIMDLNSFDIEKALTLIKKAGGWDAKEFDSDCFGLCKRPKKPMDRERKRQRKEKLLKERCKRLCTRSGKRVGDPVKLWTRAKEEGILSRCLKEPSSQSKVSTPCEYEDFI